MVVKCEAMSGGGSINSKGIMTPGVEGRRPAMDVPRQVLDSFDGLVMDNDKKRTAAAMVILQHVDKVLRAIGQGKELPEGVKYIVQRLVNGLASTRLKAREGYFSALCFILRLHPSSFTPPYILSLLTMKKSAAMKAITKDEIRDQLVGELLLCGAIVRSGHASQSHEVLQRIVNQLCAMRSKKSYLDITATQFLVNLMESCEGDRMHAEVWESLQAELQSPMADLSPSQLWMRLVLLRKHRASPPVWLTSTLAPKNHVALVQALMKTTTDLPKVHPVVEELVSSLAASRDSTSVLIRFWKTTVEPLQGNTSPGKLQILFHILKYTAPHLKTAPEFKEVVTPSVVALLLNSLTQSARDLKEAAREVTDALVHLVQDNQDEESELQLAVVKALVSPPGSVRFDQLAGHKVLTPMVRHFTLTTLKGFCNTLMDVVNKPVKGSEMVNRNAAAHTIGSLLTQPMACTPEAGPWKKKQLMALLKAVVLTPRKGQEGDTSRNAFFKALGKQIGHIREYKEILLSLVEEVDKELKAAEGGSKPSLLSDKGKQQWSLVTSRLEDLRGRECEEGTEEEIVKTVFQVLYCQMVLHLFVDMTVATENIEELTACHEMVRKLGILSTDEEEQLEDEDSPEWVEVVTDHLLTLMTQEMHLFRSVVQGLMWLLIPHMTAAALSLLTELLDTENARDLVKQEGEDDEEEEEEEEEGSDEEEEKEDDDDDDDSDDSDDGEKEGEDANLFTLKKKMLVAAGGIDVDVDMDSVPQEELDRLDERLGALLAEYRGKHPTRRKKRRKGGGGGGGTEGPQLSADEQSLMHFQSKVCDMLIIYIKAAPNMSLQVGLVNPVFEALRNADLDVRQKDLQNKLVNIITALEKKRKFNMIGDINIDIWKETVREFFTLASKMPERFLAVTRSCYSQLMHCGRLLLGTDEKAVMRPDNFLTTTYLSHLETFFTENHNLPKVQPFCEPCTYSMGGLWRVAVTLVRLSFDSNVKVHKQAQAIKMLQELYGNKTLLGQRGIPEAAGVEKDLWRKALKALGSMQSPINSLFVSNLFKLLHTILQVDRRTQPQPSLPWEEMRKSVEAFRESISKSALKSFRKEYNVFSQALSGILNPKKMAKKQGVKRGSDVKEGDKEEEEEEKEENQIKKRKKEKRSNLTDSNAEDTSTGKDKKKKKKKKGGIGEEMTSKEEEGNDEAQVIVNGDHIDAIHYRQKKDGRVMLKKKKRVSREESDMTTHQEEKVERKKRKKKQDKLTDASFTTDDDGIKAMDEDTATGKERKKKKHPKNREESDREEKGQITPSPSTPTLPVTPKSVKKKKSAS